MLLALSGIFNVFRMEDYIKETHTSTRIENGVLIEENLTSDTRTFIYENIFYTLNKNDAWIMGRTPAFGDEGILRSGNWEDIGSYKTGIRERYGNEVQIMNLLLWYGIVGCALYFLMYLRASYLAIFKSRSRFMQAIGIYTAFLWTWAFVWEVSNIEIYFMMNIIMLGICYSKVFRTMDDNEFKNWTKGIFLPLTKA
jgi:hypothetical protein